MKTYNTILYTTKRIASIMSFDQNVVEKSKRARYMRNSYRKERKYVNCVMTKEQYKELQQEAKKIGKKLTEYVREAALAHKGKKYLVPESVATELATLVFLCRNMACNINQIAKHANTFRKLRIVDVVALSGTVQELERLVKEFVEKPIYIGDDN